MHKDTCAHCGISVTARRRIASELFCCYGCEIAYAVVGVRDSAGGQSQIALYKFAAGCILGINVMMFSMPLYVETLGDFFSQGLGAQEFFDLLKWLLLALSVPVFFLLGSPFIESSFRNLRRGSALNADILIAIGVMAAFLVSIYNTVFVSGPVYYETAVGILVVVSGGRYLEARARAKAMKALDALDAKAPLQAHRMRTNGEIVTVEPKDLAPGMVIIVRPGETIPVDAVITGGASNVGEAMLTGESKSVFRQAGDELRAGALNYDGVLILKVLRHVDESYLATISRLMDQARQSRTQIEATADRIAKIAVPIIIAVALGSFGYWWYADGLRTAFLTSLSVLLIACPCALGIATPAALWVALMEASKRGILLRSLPALERLAHVQHVLFDKTGTLTKGTPQVIRETIHSDLAVSMTRHELLTMVQAVSALSHHPLARSLAAHLPKNGFSADDVIHFREVPSQGIQATISDMRIKLGKQSYVDPEMTSFDHDETTVWCSLTQKDKRNVIEFQFDDEVLGEAQAVMQKLHAADYGVTILSGDKQPVVERLHDKLGVEAKGALSPEEKVAIVHSTKHSAFVGDGINDAAAIAAADVGIALSHASDLARQDADVIIFDHAIERIPELLEYSRRTFSVIKQNLFWAFAYNGLGVIAAAVGLLNPIIAAVAMAVSSFMVMQNSLRLRGEISEKTFRAN
jgi:heavy metal translocating P-type ATPase